MKKNSLQTAGDWIMRITLAFIFIVAAYPKLIIVGPEKFAAALNIPVFLGWCATLGELGAGIGIIVGGLIKNKSGDMITRLSGLLIAFIMVVAFFLAKLKGFSADSMKALEESFDVIALCAMGLYYLLTGNGS